MKPGFLMSPSLVLLVLASCFFRSTLSAEFWNLTTSSSMPVNEGSSLTLKCTSTYSSVYFMQAPATSSKTTYCSVSATSCRSQYWCNKCYYYSRSSSGVREFRANIESVRISHAGTWRCQRSSSSSSGGSNELSISVNGKPTRPSLSSEAGAVAEGDDVTLTCSSNATSMPASTRTSLVYTWSRDGGVCISGETGTRLTLRNLTQGDQGRYTCTAQESGKALSSEASDVLFLDVQYSPRSVTLDPPDSSYQVRETTESVPNITCQADCNPPCLFRWTDKGGNAVGNTGSRLQLDTLSRNEAGVFTCSAFNHLGNASATVSISVSYPPRSVTLDPPASSYQVRETTQTVPNITCQADCNPPCFFRWTDKGGNAVGNTGSRLQLGTLSRNEAGVFTCSAFNHLGIASASISFSVSYTTPQSSALTGGAGIGIGFVIGCVISGVTAGLLFLCTRQRRQSHGEAVAQEGDNTYEGLEGGTRKRSMDEGHNQPIRLYENHGFVKMEDDPGSRQQAGRGAGGGGEEEAGSRGEQESGRREEREEEEQGSGERWQKE